MASAMSSETGSASHSGFRRARRPMPREQKRMPITIAVSAGDEFDRQVHVSGDDGRDRPIGMMPTKVDCSRMLSEDADLEEVRNAAPRRPTRMNERGSNQTRLSSDASSTGGAASCGRLRCGSLLLAERQAGGRRRSASPSRGHARFAHPTTQPSTEGDGQRLVTRLLDRLDRPVGGFRLPQKPGRRRWPW